MGDKNTIILKKDYGRIPFRFKEMMEERDINRNQLATRAGIRFEGADRF